MPLYSFLLFTNERHTLYDQVKLPLLKILKYYNIGKFLKYYNIGKFLKYYNIDKFLKCYNIGKFLKYYNIGKFLKYCNLGKFLKYYNIDKFLKYCNFGKGRMSILWTNELDIIKMSMNLLYLNYYRNKGIDRSEIY